MANEPIKRSSVLKGDKEIWFTDSGKVVGQRVKELEGQKFVLRAEDGREYIADFGVLEDGVFKNFCPVVYCERCNKTCDRTSKDKACRYCEPDGTPRQKEGRYYVDMNA